jgi:putative DNA methylase
MTWDFAEGSPFGTSSSGLAECAEVVAKVIERALPVGHGVARQASVQEVVVAEGRRAVVSMDPPYYDNVGYADLSDFFYVWLRRVLRQVFPDLFLHLRCPSQRSW